MKRILLQLSLPLIMLSLWGCNHSDSNNATPSFNWTGTAPLSVKINGVQYQGTIGSGLSELGGIYITATNGGDTGVTVAFSSVPTAGTTYDAPSPANIGMTIQTSSGSGNGQWEALSGGKVKVTSITSTTISGLFYGTLKDPTGASSATYTLTEGYFSVNIQ